MPYLSPDDYNRKDTNDLLKCPKCDGYLDELKRLRALEKLVPEAGLLRRMANHVANSFIWAKNDPPPQMAEDVDNARALAIRIERARKEIDQRTTP